MSTPARIPFSISGPGPVLRLLAGPRLLLVLVGGASWTIGAGWMGLMAHFSNLVYQPVHEQGLFVAHHAMLLLFGLPALVGLVIGEVAQELFRRPMSNRLPGAARRITGASLGIGVFTTGAVTTLVLSIWTPAGLLFSDAFAGPPTSLATLALAGLGFASGAWLTVRLGYGWAWVLRFAGYLALAYCSLPLLAEASAVTALAAATLLVSSAAVALRFHPAIVARVAQGSVPTLFGPLARWNRPEAGQATYPPVSGREPLPDGRFGGDLPGWLRARAYLESAAPNGIQAPLRLVAFAGFVLFVALAGQLVSWMLRGGSGDTPLTAELARLLLGLRAELRTPELTVPILVGTSIQAFLASTPIAESVLHPLARAMRARLVLRTAVRVDALFHLALLALALSIGAGAWALSGEPWPGGVPSTVPVVLALGAAFPWLVLVSLWVRRAFRRPRLRIVVCLAIGSGLFGLHALAELSAERLDLWPLALALCIAGFNALHFASVRVFTRASLR